MFDKSMSFRRLKYTLGVIKTPPKNISDPHEPDQGSTKEEGE